MGGLFTDLVVLVVEEADVDDVVGGEVGVDGLGHAASEDG